ncbi:hypothetical protein NKDENANG_00177 [Candidatus Entotheonellaceae bacterium PAL068K]
MYKGKSVAVVIPTHSEVKLIGTTLATRPDFVDLMIVVDDASTDQTAPVVSSYRARCGDRLLLLLHQTKQGIGAAIVSGYQQATTRGADVVAVMAGDAQMEPTDLARVVAPVASGEADYVKGTCLFRGESWQMIPHYRYLDNAVLLTQQDTQQLARDTVRFTRLLQRNTTPGLIGTGLWKSASWVGLEPL